MINFHCTIIPVVVLDSVLMTHTSAWFLDREIHQLVHQVIISCFVDYMCFYSSPHPCT